MSEIRAFVGHSFTDDDAEVVGKFLKYFDQISNLDPTFSWKHAEPAEPKMLAEKVMALLSDSNVFIGICTKKERVILDRSLTKARLRPGFLRGEEGQFAWKTSDWIIQEIGLARGKNLDLVLLVERDVRKPGGLQGDIEYIPFDRASPEKSFGKLLEMVTALSPKPLGFQTATSDPSPLQAEVKSEAESPTDDSLWTPQPDWSRARYEIALISMIANGETAAANAISAAYLTTDEATEGENKVTWDAFSEFFRLNYGKGGSLSKLRELADAHPNSTATLRYLAGAFERYGDYSTAASTYEAAANRVTDDSRALDLMRLAAMAYAHAGVEVTASGVVQRMKERVESSLNGELQLLKVLRELAEITKNDEVALATMERIVEVDPSDINLRFSLAYKHSEYGNDDLTLLHYLRIPWQERNSMTWNNLGVAFDHFSLAAKSVSAYRQAEELDETLAMNNLALKFIAAGFLAEAQEHCDRALSIENYHKNIGYTLSKLRGLPEDEDRKEAEILEKTKPKSEFYQEFGRAVCRREPNELAENWEGPDCLLKVNVLGQKFEAVGSYAQRSSNALTSAFRASGEGPSTRNRVEYSGTLRGRAIQARVTRTPESPSPAATTLLTSVGDETSVLMVLSDDGSEIRVLERSPRTNPRFYALKRRISDS